MGYGYGYKLQLLLIQLQPTVVFSHSTTVPSGHWKGCKNIKVRWPLNLEEKKKIRATKFSFLLPAFSAPSQAYYLLQQYDF